MKSEEQRDRNKGGKSGTNQDQDRNKQRDQGTKRPEGSPDREREQKGNRDSSRSR